MLTAVFSLFSAYGMLTQFPSPLNTHPWNGHSRQSPFTRPPIAKFPPMWGQYASSTCTFPDFVRNTAKCWPVKQVGSAVWFHSGAKGDEGKHWYDATWL